MRMRLGLSIVVGCATCFLLRTMLQTEDNGINKFTMPVGKSGPASTSSVLIQQTKKETYPPAKVQEAKASTTLSSDSGKCQIVVDRPGGIDDRYLYERRWLEELVGTCITTIQKCSPSTCDARIIISRVRGGHLNNVEEKFVKNTRGSKTLWHLSDEFRNPKHHDAIRKEYKRWGRVLRMYYDAAYNDLPNVHWIPLGYGSTGFDWSRAPTPIPPASSRPTAVTFTGNTGNNFARKGMVREFEKMTKLVVRGLVRDAGFGVGNRTEYVDSMFNSKFCLALPGSSLETFRLYEALQAGCIPIMLDKWTKGKEWVNFTGGLRPYIRSIEEISVEKEVVDMLQQSYIHMWHNIKDHYKNLIRSPLS